MFTLVLIIHIIVSLILIGAVLLQAGKGATMGSSFGGGSSQTVFGSSGPATLLAKVTYVCIGIFMLTSLSLTYLSRHVKEKSIMSNMPAASAPAQTAPAATPAPAAPQPPAAMPAAPAPAAPAK